MAKNKKKWQIFASNQLIRATNGTNRAFSLLRLLTTPSLCISKQPETRWTRPHQVESYKISFESIFATYVFARKYGVKKFDWSKTFSRNVSAWKWNERRQVSFITIMPEFNDPWYNSRRRQSFHSTKKAKRQSAEFREREAEAMATKRQCPDFREREKLRVWLLSASLLTSERKRPRLKLLNACLLTLERKRPRLNKTAKRQSADYREKETQLLNAGVPKFKEKEAHAKKHHQIKQIPVVYCKPLNIHHSYYRRARLHLCLLQSIDVLENRDWVHFTVPAGSVDKLWICKTCDCALKQVQLISLRIPFMKMVALPVVSDVPFMDQLSMSDTCVYPSTEASPKRACNKIVRLCSWRTCC